MAKPLDQPSSPTAAAFARHETFHPRHGWLKKGFDAASEDPEVFLRPDAAVRLGVGKNMVRAIRYWCHAFKVLEEIGGRGDGSRPTAFGAALLAEDGLDPYLENLGSLWLLHWRLLQEPNTATAWWYTFFVRSGLDVTADDLTGELLEYVRREYPNARAAESSVRKDATCILRMYGEVSSKELGEESIHCPWAELHLLRPGRSARSYAFRVGQKPGLSHQLISAACLEYATSRRAAGAQTIALGALVHGRGSPGAAFKLSDNSIYAALEGVSRTEPTIEVSDGAGMVQLSFSTDSASVAARLIQSHYQKPAPAEALPWRS